MVSLLARPTNLASRYVCSTCAREALRNGSRRYATRAGLPSAAELYDVVCVGGGPVGLSLIAALLSSPATSSLKIALVESQDLARAKAWDSPDGVWSNRASSITPASQRFLQQTQSWPLVKQSRIQPFQGMQVWDGVSGSRIDFEGQDDATTTAYNLAYMTENQNLVQGLLHRIARAGMLDVFDSTRVSDITLGPPEGASVPSELDLSLWPHLRLSNDRTLAARLLVGADGLDSPVRQFAEIASPGWDYDRHGVVATLRYEHPPERRIAFQRFLPTGPIALLPLPGPFATLVWSTTPSRASHLKALSSADLVALVNAGFRLSRVDVDYMHTLASGQVDELAWRLQHTPNAGQAGLQVPALLTDVQEGSVASFPLRFRHADTYVGHRVALIGDAAHTIHPLAGQGLNMGLGDAEALFRNIEYSVRHGRDLGDSISLESFNRERYELNHRLLGTVDKLHKLYSWSAGPAIPLRSWGLAAVNALQPVKSFLIQQASQA